MDFVKWSVTFSKKKKKNALLGDQKKKKAKNTKEKQATFWEVKETKLPLI